MNVNIFFITNFYSQILAAIHTKYIFNKLLCVRLKYIWAKSWNEKPEGPQNKTTIPFV